MIEISGSESSVASQVTAALDAVLMDEAKKAGEDFSLATLEAIDEWAWNRYASRTYVWSGSVSFEAPYDTWDELLDAYREAQFDRYAESRIG